MDVYLPSNRSPGTPVPAVLLVHGEADPELLRGVRGWGQYIGWGRLLADQGIAGFSAGVVLTTPVLAGAAERIRCAALCYGPLSDLERPGAAAPAGGAGRPG
jgi:hypothetical protein